MAQFVPSLNEAIQRMDTAGERNVAKFLNQHLPEDSIVWCNIPVGDKRLYADFLILLPKLGLLCLEVKDWKLKSLNYFNPQKCELMVDGQSIVQKHPLEQARGYIQYAANLLKQDKHLLQKSGAYQGALIFPYAHGVVFTHLAHAEIKKLDEAVGNAVFKQLFPIKQTWYKESLQEKSSERVYSRLEKMFTHSFPCSLDTAQIDRIRYCLFPEIRIRIPQQQELFADDHADDKTEQQPEHRPADSVPHPIAAPDIIKIMDIQQEQLARSIGGGHRVIHGVAGSGKTLILLMRCQYLAEQSDKPVLVLCYNRVLADKLRTAVADKGLAEKVEVCSFHQWCGKLQKAYGLETPERYRHLPGYEHAPLTVLQAMHDGTLPGGRYGAVLIDEGHDFEADWLRLSVHMLDADNGHLLLLYDDAQAIYKKSGAGLGFTLSSVGIKAQGRTTILRLNYRNTKEIIGFAYLFAQNKMQPHESGEDGVPLVEPEAAGVNGISPYIKECPDWQGELDYLARCLDKWLKDRIPPQDIAVICYNKEQCNDVAKLLKQKGIRHSLHYGGSKKAYNPHDNAVAVFTMHSSKGLEFQRVMLMGICTLKHKDANQEVDNTRLLYVAMTRAQNYLMITLSGSGLYQSRLLDSYRQFKQLNDNNANKAT